MHHPERRALRQKLSKGTKDRQPHGKKKLEEYGAKASLGKAWDTLQSGTWSGRAGRDAEGRNRDEGLGGWKQTEMGTGRCLAFLEKKVCGWLMSSRAPHQRSRLGTLSPHPQESLVEG